MYGNYAGGGAQEGEGEDNSQSGSFSLASLLNHGSKKYERRMGKTTSDMKPVRLGGWTGTKGPTTPRRFLLTDTTQAPPQPILSHIQEEQQGDQSGVQKSLSEVFSSSLQLSSHKHRSMTKDSTRVSPGDSGSFSMSLTEAAEGLEDDKIKTESNHEVDKENFLSGMERSNQPSDNTSRIRERLQRLAGQSTTDLVSGASSGLQTSVERLLPTPISRSATDLGRVGHVAVTGGGGTSGSDRLHMTNTPSLSRSTTLPGMITSSRSQPRPIMPASSNMETPRHQTAPRHYQQITPQYVLQTPKEMPPPYVSAASKGDQVLQVKGRNYRVMKLLGKGGSSRVYEAFDETRNMVVAIKRVNLAEADEAQTEGYINEINMLSQLQGEDRIVKLYDHENVPEEDILYVILEKGDTDLASLLKKYSSRKELTQAMIKHYWTEMLHAVSVIHNQGIIHKDLKPANFLLVAGRLKLIDFGIASAVQSDKTSVMIDTQMGTFNFMSPESIQDLNGPQFDNSGVRKPCIRISVKSDVWSLGCILYNLTYGKMPFGDIKHPLMKLQAITNREHLIPYPPLEDADPILISLIKSCLVRDPRERPGIGELLQHPYVTGEQVRQADLPQKLDRVSAVQALAALEGIMSPGTLEKTRQKLRQYNLS